MALPADRIRDRKFRCRHRGHEPERATTRTTLPTPSFAFGDFVTVPCPFTSQASSQQWPAVVLSAAACNVVTPDIELTVHTNAITL